jgi:hypothetical protein
MKFLYLLLGSVENISQVETTRCSIDIHSVKVYIETKLYVCYSNYVGKQSIEDLA